MALVLKQHAVKTPLHNLQGYNVLEYKLSLKLIKLYTLCMS